MSDLTEASRLLKEGRTAFEDFCNQHEVPAVFGPGDVLLVPEEAWREFITGAIHKNRQVLDILTATLGPKRPPALVALEEYVVEYENLFQEWGEGSTTLTTGRNFPRGVDELVLQAAFDPYEGGVCQNKHPFEVPGEGLVAVDTPSTWAMMRLLGDWNSFEGVALSREQEKALMAFYDFDDALDVRKAQEAQEAQVTAWEERRQMHAQAKEAGDWAAYDIKYGCRKFSEKPRLPEKPKPTNPLPFLRAGATKNMLRFCRRDGLRVMAFLARYLERGEDPVRLVAKLCIEAGYDVTNDSDWIFGDDLEE